MLVVAGCGLFATAAAVTAATWPTTVSRGVVPRPALPVAFSPAPAAAVPTASPAPVSVPAVKPVVVPHWRGPLVSGPVRPVRLVVPAAGVDAPVAAEPVSATGSLGVPDDPATLGWWAAGPMPGAAKGTAVIDGHVDSAAYGPGALSRLGDVVPGQQLAVTGAAGSEVFTVDAVRQFSKSSLASAGVFDQRIGGRLVIVTCGGPFDAATHTYRDNVVVYATPATR